MGCFRTFILNPESSAPTTTISKVMKEFKTGSVHEATFFEAGGTFCCVRPGFEPQPRHVLVELRVKDFKFKTNRFDASKGRRATAINSTPTRRIQA